MHPPTAVTQGGGLRLRSTRPTRLELVENVGFLFEHQVGEQAETVPGHVPVSELAVSHRGLFIGHDAWCACGFSEQLRLACAVHRDEPPGRFFHALANGQ